MEPRAGGVTDPRGSRGGRGLSLPAGPRARQLLARLDARPLAARAAADVAALVRRTGATLRLRPKAGACRGRGGASRGAGSDWSRILT
uniref:PDZ domain-containing protein MAGIX-like n=1 Tax=Panthera onca TaxID=9690 RepID=UPI0009055F6C|nr:PDZ domain-containing protein MAGIX-like [Panthera onca]XP_060483501.1 PDZ domain-containing protein MAGIX-like [Panthera onca]